MNHSAVIDELSVALITFQQEMPQVKKGNTAEVVMKSGGKYKYKYADLADVFIAALPVATRNGLGILQGFSDGKLQTRLIHKSGQWIEDDGLQLPTNLTPQELGAAVTYFRRYGSLAALGIAPEEDDDAAGIQAKGRTQVQPIRSNFKDQLQQSVNPDADDELSFLNDDRPPQEVAFTPKNPANKPVEGAISAGQVKRLWAIAKQVNRGKDSVLRIVSDAGFEAVEEIHWKKYNEIIEAIQAA